MGLGFALWAGPAGAGGLETTLERALGKPLAEAFAATLGLVPSPTLRTWVQETGQHIASLAFRRDIPYTFYVADTEEINAFALPGGHIFITRGLLGAAESEDEVAGVLAHEIGHVAHRHALKQGKWQLLTQWAIGTVKDEDLRSLVSVLHLLNFFATMKFSRDMELEADRFGAEYTYRAGYDPDGLVDFFERLLRLYPKEPSRWAVLLSTHPPLRQRLAQVQGSPFNAPLELAGWLELGHRAEERLRFSQALERYREAAKRFPEAPEPWAAQSRLWLRLGNSEAARRAWEEAQRRGDEEPFPSAPPLPSPSPSSPFEALPSPTSPPPWEAQHQALAEFRNLLREILRMRNDNQRLDDLLLANPRIEDPKWWWLFGNLRAMVEMVDRVLARCQSLAGNLIRAEGEWKRIWEQAQQPATHRAGQRWRKEWATASSRWERAWSEALQEGTRALQRLDRAVRLMTPLLVDVLDPYTASPRRYSYARFAVLEGLLYTVERYLDSSEEAAARARQRAGELRLYWTTARIGEREERLGERWNPLWAQAVARWGQVEPETLLRLLERDRGWSEVALMALLAQEESRSLQEVLLANSGEMPWSVFIATRPSVDLDALSLLLQHLSHLAEEWSRME